MVEIYGEDKWNVITELLLLRSVFFNISFVKALAKVYDGVPKLYVYYKATRPVCAIACIVKYDKIIAPTHFMRNGLWVSERESGYSKLLCLKDFLVQLTKLHSFIHLRLDTTITDIRPFIWSGFKIYEHFTYLKKTNEKKYHNNVIRNVKKAQKQTFIFRVDEHDHILISHISDLKNFGFSKQNIDSLKQFFSLLKNSGLVIELSLQNEAGYTIASHILLLDSSCYIAYTLLISTSEGSYSSGIHSLMYDRVFDWCNINGYKSVDLYGANVEGFALFKSKFNADLKQYYHVKYDRRKAFFNNLISKLKNKVRPTLNLLRR